jgi:hypothetical protein
MENPHMPARNHSSAPRFDSKKPRELPAYFDELEALMEAAKIVEGSAKKAHAKRYAHFNDGELWASLPEFAEPFTYEMFKAKVLEQYPGATAERRYNIQDVDKLVGERLRLGIISLEDLATYYRQFYVMTQFLIDRGRYSSAEQSRAFIRGLQPQFCQRVDQRLQLRHPDHHPEDPYTLSEVNAAATFVLQGSSFSNAPFAESPAQIEPASRPIPTVQLPTTIKTEDMLAMFERFAQTIATSLSAGNNLAPPPATRPFPGNRGGCCNFCGDPAHFISRCPIVEEYRLAGKIRKNAEGKVVLPSGSFVPGNIPGQWLKDRVDEWYRQLPASSMATPAAPTLFYSLNTQPARNPAPAVPTLQVAVTDKSYDKEIGELQQQIMALHAKKKKMIFDGVEINTKARGGPRKEQATASTSSSADQATPTPLGPAAAPEIEPAPAKTAETQEPVVAVPAPGHPFTDARDANYLPPKDRNFGAAPPIRGRDPAYHAQAPIQDSRVAETVYKRTLQNPAITLSYEELFALSPDVRQKYRDALTPKRVPNTRTHLLATGAEDPLPFSGDNSGGSIDGMVIDDPLAIYFNDVAGLDAIPIRVAKDSHSLRSIMMLIDNKEEIECVLDPGSMIIAISEACCNSLGLLYDPTFRLHMESANGEVDESLGLARNVPFSIGPVTLFLQLHVVRSPAYDILLGRPFDVLTQSVIKNYQNEDMTLTIEDPNAHKVCTIPTLRRGPPRYSMKPTDKQQDFRQGRN